MADQVPATSSTLSTDFDAVFRLHYPRLVPFADRLLVNRAEAEDVVQEAFLRLARLATQSSDPDDESSLRDRSPEVVAAWLRRVVLNLSMNRIRDQRRAAGRLARAGRLDADLDPARGAGDTANPTTVMLRAEAQAEVRAALASLPERQRACLLLRHGGHSYAEIAETLGIAVGSVGVYLMRAERAFRAAYRSDDLEEGQATPRGATE